MRGDFVASLQLMLALARRGEIECYADHNGIHVWVKGEEVALLSLEDRPDVKRQLDDSRVAFCFGGCHE